MRVDGITCSVIAVQSGLSSTQLARRYVDGLGKPGAVRADFELPETNGDRHIALCSWYRPHTDTLHAKDAEELLELFLKSMFPNPNRSWISDHRLWCARWSQPMVEKNCRGAIPREVGLRADFHALISPVGRGKNHSTGAGKGIGKRRALSLLTG